MKFAQISEEQFEEQHEMKMQADQLLTPGEQFSVDFATYNNKNMLVVKDRAH